MTDDRDLVDLLTECAEFLDDRADVEDGDDGRPRANRAMQLHARVREFLDRRQRYEPNTDPRR